MKIDSEKVKALIENATCYFLYYGERYIDQKTLLEEIKELEKENEK